MKRKQLIVRRPKNRCDRIVHIDRYTAHYLKKYIKEARPWLSGKNKTIDNLFLIKGGIPINRVTFYEQFKRKYAPIMREKFKKHITPYSFRHTSATHWMDEGTKCKKDLLPYVQRQLGHKSLESTAVYTRVAIEPLREMFKRYHPRELDQKSLRKVPSPTDIISRLNDKK